MAITLSGFSAHSESNMESPIGVVLFGEVGTGKSTLGNTLLGTSAFTESSRADAETLETVARDGHFEGVATHVMDTPGMGHSMALDAAHLVEMANKLKSDSQIRAILMIFNYNAARFEDREANLLRIVNNAFQGREWYRHVAFVHTHYYKTLPPDMRTQEAQQLRSDGCCDKMHSYFPAISLSEVRNIPQFFLDSKEARDPQETSASVVREILAWASCLNPLSQDLPAMNVPNGPSRVEKRNHVVVGRTETHEWRGGRRYGAFGPRSHHGKTMQERITIYEERTVQPMTAGPDQVVVDWHEVRRTSDWVEIASW